MSPETDLSPLPADQSQAEPETTVDPPMVTRLGTECRRKAPRTRVRPGATVEARKWVPVPGHNVAVQFLDISAAGVRILLRPPVALSDLYTLTLRDPDGRRVAQMVASVRWRSADRDGVVIAGLAFSHSLPPEVLDRLAAPPDGPRS